MSSLEGYFAAVKYSKYINQYECFRMTNKITVQLRILSVLCNFERFSRNIIVSAQFFLYTKLLFLVTGPSNNNIPFHFEMLHRTVQESNNYGGGLLVKILMLAVQQLIF